MHGTDRGAGRSVGYAGYVARAAAVGLYMLLVGAGGARATEIRRGAIETGISGTFRSAGGVSTARFGIGVGAYRGGISDVTRVRLGVGLAWERVSDLDVVDLEASFALVGATSEGGSYLGLAIVSGVRQEWLGSFSSARVPLGGDLELKLLSGGFAAATLAYQYRHFFGDDAGPADEHRFVISLSLFFRNGKESS